MTTKTIYKALYLEQEFSRVNMEQFLASYVAFGELAAMQVIFIWIFVKKNNKKVMFLEVIKMVKYYSDFYPVK
jgi:hypothetical protein